MQEELQEEKQKKKKGIILIIFLIVIILILFGYIILGRKKADNGSENQNNAIAMEEDQGEYVKPEEPVDRSKNVTLPGWGGFTIPANTKEITQGFEFHNPEENLWYEDQISIDGNDLEKLVVDSGNKTELNHYLSLAGIDETVAEVTDYDTDSFKIEKSESGSYTVEGVGGYEGTKTITVKTEAGNEVKIDVTCNENYYYMTFGLYLTENDELLYQSDLVSPGKYVQKMEMSRSLEPGTYDAYVVCQPYRSDGTTKTNQGVVKITLTAK